MKNIDEIREAQRNFFLSGKTKDPGYLRRKLKELKAEIKNSEAEINEVLKKDFNKPEFESYLSEIGIVLSELDLAIKNIKSWARPKRVRASLLNFPSKDYIYSEPYGSILIIAPWNYPFQLAVAPAIAAIAAGNTVVLKPSELTPHTTQLVEDLLAKVFDEEHLAVVQGAVPVATELLSKRWDYIFFTGSVPVGKIVAKAAAEFMTPVTLELGGKSPCIIDDSVSTKLIAKRVVWGKLVNAGQTCIAPDYLIVKSGIKDKLISDIIQEIESVLGADAEQSDDYARIINSRNLGRLRKMLENVDVVYGGKVNEKTNYLSPTIINEPSLNDAVMQEEIFGPILPILTYETLEDVYNIVEHFEKPLSYYIFSKRPEFWKALLKRHSFGGGVINDTMIHFGNHRLPFGGVGDSGIGAYHGRLGFDTFTHKKPVVRKSTLIDIPVRYAPYKGKLKILKTFFRLFG